MTPGHVHKLLHHHRQVKARWWAELQHVLLRLPGGQKVSTTWTHECVTVRAPCHGHDMQICGGNSVIKSSEKIGKARSSGLRVFLVYKSACEPPQCRSLHVPALVLMCQIGQRIEDNDWNLPLSQDHVHSFYSCLRKPLTTGNIQCRCLKMLHGVLGYRKCLKKRFK